MCKTKDGYLALIGVLIVTAITVYIMHENHRDQNTTEFKQVGKRFTYDDGVALFNLMGIESHKDDIMNIYGTTETDFRNFLENENSILQKQ